PLGDTGRCARRRAVRVTSRLSARREGGFGRATRAPVGVRLDPDTPNASGMARRRDRAWPLRGDAGWARPVAAHGATLAVLRRSPGEDRDGVREVGHGD